MAESREHLYANGSESYQAFKWNGLLTIWVNGISFKLFFFTIFLTVVLVFLGLRNSLQSVFILLQVVKNEILIQNLFSTEIF